MDEIDGTLTTETEGDRPFTEADLEAEFEAIAFGILDAVVLGPMRSEMMNMHEEDQSSSTYF